MENYRNLIKNNHRVFHLPKMEAYLFDKADLCAFVNRFSQKYPDSEITEQLNEICCPDCNSWEEVIDERKKRMEVVKQMLYSAWKVSCKVGDTYEPQYYMFPYKVNDTTNYMFMLYVPCGCQYIRECLSDTSEDPINWDNKDLLFEEVELNEMMDKASECCNTMIDNRLRKLVERDKVISKE